MSFSYFKDLNYTLANEDTALELGILPEGQGHVVSVAGSGARVLPLAAKKPKIVTCVDLARPQLELVELRVESARGLSHPEFLKFWGFPPEDCTPEERKSLFEKIRLSSESRADLKARFEAHGWESILYEGKWERTFAKLSTVNQRLTGEKGRALFDAKTLSEQRDYLKSKFPWTRWKTVLFVLGNAAVFNALLYKGHFPKKNIDGSLYRFYRRTFDHLFEQGPASENFFLQLVFFGKIVFPEGNPVECDPKVYASIQEGLKHCEVRYVQGSVVDVVSKSQEPVDFLSISDVPSYFSEHLGRTYLQNLREGMAPGGQVVLRSYLHVPENTDLSGYSEVTSRYAEEIAKEKVGVYRVQVFEKSPE